MVFIEISSQTRGFVKDAIESKMWSALRQQLGVDQLEKIRISFEFFPETLDKEPPSPAKRRLYRDLYRKDRRVVPHAIKRVVDVLGSLMALTLLSPVFALIALLIKLTSKGSVFFRQTRVGQYGIPFTFFKFRSMRSDSDLQIHQEYVKQFIAGNTSSNSCEGPESGIYKLTFDPRVVPFGRFLRKTSLDELPQFWNVLRGEMSLVGPRPPTPYELELYQPWHRRILETKPGITGLWQVNGRSKGCSLMTWCGSIFDTPTPGPSGCTARSFCKHLRPSFPRMARIKIAKTHACSFVAWFIAAGASR